MGRASREKGKRGEREVADLLRAHGFEARRGVQYRGGPDSPDVVGLPGWHIEVKRTERLALRPALEQAEREAPEGSMPLVLHRSNGSGWVAILRAEDLLALIRETRKP